MRSYVADRIRVSLILAVFAIPLLSLYVAQNYEEWAFADLGRSVVPQYVRFGDVHREPFLTDDEGQTAPIARVAAAAGR